MVFILFILLDFIAKTSAFILAYRYINSINKTAVFIDCKLIR